MVAAADIRVASGDAWRRKVAHHAATGPAPRPGSAGLWKWLLLLFIAQSPLYPLQIKFAAGAEAGVSKFVLVQLGLTLLASVAIFSKPASAGPLARASIPFALYLLICGLLLPLAVDQHWSAVRLLLFGIIVVTAFGAAAQLSMRDLGRCIVYLLAVNAFTSLAANFAFPAAGAGLDLYTGGWRGMYATKNVLGHVAGISVALLVAVGARTFASPLLWLASLVISITCVLLSHSATGLLIGMTLIMVYAALIGTRGPLRIFVLTAVVLASVAVVLAPMWAFSDLLELLGKDATLTGRTFIWRLATQIAQQHPIGGGYNYTGSSEIAGRLGVGFNVYGVHNAYLDTLINVGWAGTFMLLFAVAAALVAAWRRPMSGDAERARLLLTLLMTGCLISGLTESFISLPNGTMALLWILAIFGLYRVGISPADDDLPGQRDASGRRAQA